LDQETSTVISTPYRATAEEIKLVKESVDKLTVGDNKDKVLDILGTPDEIKPLYHKNDMIELNPFSKPKPAGESYWYILARDKDSGSLLKKINHS